MKIALGVIIPAILSIAVCVGMFFYFLYPMLTVVAADYEIGHIKSSYVPGEKIVIPAVLTNTTGRPLSYSVLSNIKSQKESIFLSEKQYKVEAGKIQNFNFEADISSKTAPGDYVFTSAVRIKKYGKGSMILARAQRYFEINPYIKPAEAAVSPKIETKIPLVAEIVSAVLKGDVIYGSAPVVEINIKNKSKRAGEFTVILEITNPAGIKEEISKRVALPAQKSKTLNFQYFITEDKDEGKYTAKVYYSADNSPIGSNQKNLQFSLVDRLPEVKFRSIVLSRPDVSGVDFNMDISDDLGVEEVYFIYKPVSGNEARNFAMEMISGNKRRGVWTFHSEEQPGSKVEYSVLAVDSKGQKLKTAEHRLEIPVK